MPPRSVFALPAAPFLGIIAGAMTTPRPAQPRAFTLMEILCVLGIVAVLAAVAIGPIFRALSKAKSLGTDSKPHSHEVITREYEKL